ncbi:MAG: hypothetical protein ACKVTZ_22655 [Bacteroidia bacterium]
MKNLILSFIAFLFWNNGQLLAQTESLLIKNTWLPNKRLSEIKVADTLLLTQQAAEMAGDLKFLATKEFEMLRFHRECVSVPSIHGEPRKHIIRGDNIWIKAGNWAVEEDKLRLIFYSKKIALHLIAASENTILYEVSSID